MKYFGIFPLVILFLMTVVQAEEPEGKKLAIASFTLIDSDGNGTVGHKELAQSVDTLFVSMDSNDNGSLSLDEYLGWGFGFQNIATDSNRELAYKTALKVVFSFWDSDADGVVSQAEFNQAQLNGFNRADKNNDNIMTKTEFLGYFPIMVAIRYALKPE